MHFSQNEIKKGTINITLKQHCDDLVCILKGTFTLAPAASS